MKIFTSIKSNQLALAIIVSMVPLLVVGQLINEFTSSNIRETVKNNLRQITYDKAQSISKWVLERKSDVILLASTSSVIDLVNGENVAQATTDFEFFYQRFVHQYGTYSWIRISGENGETIYTYPESFPESLVPAMQAPELFLATMSEAVLIDGKAHTFITSVVSDGQGKTGRIVVAVSLETLNQITDNIRVGTTGEAYIVNSHGRFVTHRERSRVLAEDHSELPIFARLISGQEHDFVGEVQDYRNIPVLGAYFYLPDLKWGLVAEQDVAEAFLPQRTFSRKLSWFVLISALLVTIISYALTALNLRSLGDLKRTIEKIRQGETHTRFPVKTQNEIGQTGVLFNEMLDELNAAQVMLRHKVEAADRDLLRAHEELKKRHEDLKEVQEALLRSERLATMGEVAAGLAHEINNPLATINMLICSLQSLDDLSEAERTKVISVISSEIEKIANMIDRFHDLTHPQELRHEAVIIERIIDRTLTLLQPKLQKTGIQVNTRIAEDLPTIYGDERHLGQLLLNLLLNSIHAMPNGGEITIVAGYNEVGGNRYMRLSVSDSGTGIPDEIRNKIFSPFFTTRAEGTGLGLLMVQRIVEYHAGQIDVETAMGAGTTFHIDLPAHR